MLETKVSYLKDNLYIYALSAYMFLLGSHLLVHYLWIFILPALLLIDWKKKFPIEIYFLFFFLISLYGVYIYGHRGIFHDSKWSMGVIVEIVMIFLVYLLGISPKKIDKIIVISDKKTFYLLYGFFIAYVLGIVYSYYFLPQNNPLTSFGFRVFYTKAHDLHLHKDGQLTVTLVAYFLSFLIAILPLILFNLKKLRRKKFTYIELLLILSLGIFSMYIAFGLGRRLSLLILILFLLYFAIYSIYNITKRYDIYYSLSILVITILMAFFVYYIFIQDSYLIVSIKYKGYADPRYNYWFIGLKDMWKYPFGGADKLPVFSINPRAHNTWIDIGKSFGIIAFITSILFYIIHIKYFIKIILNKNISLFIKNITLTIAFVLFANMMVEPIFHTEKSLFFYSLFFLGFMKFYSDTFSDTEKITTLS